MTNDKLKSSVITVGVISIAVVLSLLMSTGLITVGGFSGDMSCAGTESDPCFGYINITANKDIYIMPHEAITQKLVEFNTSMDTWKLQVNDNDVWQTYDFSTPCTEEYCGVNTLVNSSLHFKKNGKYELRILAYKDNPFDTVDWSLFNNSINATWDAPMVDIYKYDKDIIVYMNSTNVDVIQTCRSIYWNCTPNLSNMVIECDSLLDGNGNGVCREEQGESCAYINITYEQLIVRSNNYMELNTPEIDLLCT